MRATLLKKWLPRENGGENGASGEHKGGVVTDVALLLNHMDSGVGRFVAQVPRI